MLTTYPLKTSGGSEAIAVDSASGISMLSRREDELDV